MGNKIHVERRTQKKNYNNMENKIHVERHTQKKNYNNIQINFSQKILNKPNNIHLKLPRKIYDKLILNYSLTINLSYIISKYNGSTDKQYIYKCIFDFDTFLYQIKNLINILIEKYLNINIIKNTLNIINYIFKKNIIQYQYILQNNIDDYYLDILNNFINDIDYIIINFNYLIDEYPIIENELNNLKIHYDKF